MRVEADGTVVRPSNDFALKRRSPHSTRGLLIMSPSDSSRLKTFAKCSSMTASSRAAPVIRLKAGHVIEARILRCQAGSVSVPVAHS